MGPPETKSARPAVVAGASAGISREAEIREDEYRKSPRDTMHLVYVAPGWKAAMLPPCGGRRLHLRALGNVVYLPAPRIGYQLVERENGVAVVVVLLRHGPYELFHARSWAEAHSALATMWHTSHAYPVLPERRAGA